MEVILDRATGWPVPAADWTLGALVRDIRQKVESRGRVVLSLILDGEALSSGHLDRLQDQSVHAFGLLEVKTVESRSVCRATLVDLIPYLARLEKRHQDGLSLVRAGDVTAGLEQLAHALEGWQVFTNAVRDLARLAKVDASAMSPWAVTLEERVRRQEHTLSGFRTTLEKQDAAALSELVERDLRPLLHEWRSVLESLAATLDRRGKA